MTAATPHTKAGAPAARLPASLGGWLDRLATAALASAAGAVLVLGVAAVLGFQPMVDRSDSMRPAIRAGDLIVVRQAAARTAAVGDVATLWDSRRKRSLTHRIVGRRTERGKIAFVTRGDANTARERWSVEPEARIGLLVTALPRVGYAVGWLTAPAVRLALVTCCGLALCAGALRWLWYEER